MHTKYNKHVADLSNEDAKSHIGPIGSVVGEFSKKLHWRIALAQGQVKK